MKMTSNCSLEMGLLPSASASSTKSPALEVHNGDNGRQLYGQQQQQMTFFYNGTVCACDVTEFQAKTIIRLASRVVEERSTAPTHPNSPSLQRPLYRFLPDAAPPPAPPPAAAPAPAPAPPPTMKRSLQRFLEKRNHRIHAAGPYHH